MSENNLSKINIWQKIKLTIISIIKWTQATYIPLLCAQSVHSLCIGDN